LNQWRLYNVGSAAGDYKIRIDTDLHYSTSTNTVYFPSTPRLGGALGIIDHSWVSIFFDGHIAEVLIYDTILSDTDRRAVETYLCGEWELEWCQPVVPPVVILNTPTPAATLT